MLFENARLLIIKLNTKFGKSEGMEMVQVAILIAIVVVLGLIFKTQLTNFVNGVFKDLMRADF